MQNKTTNCTCNGLSFLLFSVDNKQDRLASNNLTWMKKENTMKKILWKINSTIKCHINPHY